MADISSWTATARNQHNNSVVLAVPASSNPLSAGTSVEFGLEAATDGGALGLAFGAAVMALATLKGGILRLKNRRAPVGERDVNDRVVLVFYPDRVDVHSRPPVLKRVGDLLTSRPLDQVRLVDAKLVVGGTPWILSASRSQTIRKALETAGIDLPE